MFVLLPYNPNLTTKEEWQQDRPNMNLGLCQGVVAVANEEVVFEMITRGTTVTP